MVDWYRLRPKHPRIVAGVLGVVGVALVIWGVLAAGHGGGEKAAVQPSVPGSGTAGGGAQPKSPKIVGGKPAAKQPYLVSIQHRDSTVSAYKHICHGSIADDKFVSTTAYCIHGRKMKHLSLVMGRSNLDGEGGEKRGVIDVTINSKWTPGVDWSNDEAVLEMDRPVVFGEDIQRVCFADEGSVFPTGMTAEVFGWGNVGQSEPLPPPRTLQGVNVTVTDHDNCTERYNGMVTKDMICTSNVAGDKDTCHGDEGAPLVAKQGDEYIQVGTVIRIPDQCAVPYMETVSWKNSKTFMEDAIKAMRDPKPTSTPETPRPVVQCGIKNSAPPGGRVENGQEVHPPHAYGWMASIEDADGTFWGGATLINESFVVTKWASPGEFVVLGAHDRSSTTEDTQRIMIEEVIRHPNKSSMYHPALARLSHPVNLTRHVQPICLPDPADLQLPAGTTYKIAGWGRGNGGSGLNDLLQEGSVTSITNQQCRDAYPSDWHKHITKYTICTAVSETRPSWMDNGGPLMHVNKDNVHFLYGVQFWDGCSWGHPALFYNVPEFLPWINSVLFPQSPAPTPEPSSGICFKKYEG